MGWVANSGFWVGYIADLGPYLGPWPPPIPPPQALAIAAGEVDYVIGVPDPGTSSGLAGDVYLDLYRFWNSTPGDYFNTGYTWVDGGVTPGDPANHLFVTFYNPAFADPGTYSPTVDPEQLAPSWMAASGVLPVPEPPVSPTWAAIPDGAGWGTGGHFWLADLGPYVGPWPPAPPIPANLPFDFGSVPFPPAPGTYLYVDYLVTTSDAAAIIAASNDGYELYRWPGSGTPELGSMLGSTRSPLPGQHLWVTVRMGARTDEPAYSPLSMAPPLYVAGGLGVQLGDPSAGHWSAPLAYPVGLESSPSFTITNPGLPKTGLMPGSSTPGHVSPVGLETTASQACYGSVPSNPHSDDGQAEFGIGFQTGNFPDFTQAPFGVDEIRQTDLRLSDEWGYNFFAVQNIHTDAAGDYGDWGVEGIDYVAAPDDSTMTVTSVDGTDTGWRSWVSLSVDYTAAAAFNSGNFLVGFATTGTFQFGWYLLGGYTANNAWLLDGSGAPVATTNVTVATNANHTTSSVAGTEVVDLSSSPISCQLTLKPMDVSVGVAPLDLDTTATGTGSADIDWRIHPDAMTATASISYSDMHFWVPPTPVYPQPFAAPVAHYLRMTQRGDGLGISPAPRIAAGQVRSEQGAALRRVGGANTFT